MRTTWKVYEAIKAAEFSLAKPYTRFEHHEQFTAKPFTRRNLEVKKMPTTFPFTVESIYAISNTCQR